MRPSTKAVHEKCAQLGFTLHSWNPGDGKHRFSFNRPGQRHMFAMGSKMALAMLDAWERGYEEASQGAPFMVPKP